MESAPDRLILDRALKEGRILISADADFGALLALWQRRAPSVVLLRRTSPRKPEDQAALLLANLPALADRLQQGSIVVVERNRVRVRPLPVWG